MPAETSVPPRRLDDFRVGDWLAEPALCRLSRGDACIRLRPQLMDLLVCLARQAGRVVARDAIFAEIWPGQFVAESGLARCVAELRQALNDDPHAPTFIETIPKRGYRLIAPVTFIGRDEPEPATASPGGHEPETPDGGPPGEGPAAGPGTEPADLPAASPGPSRQASLGARLRRHWILVAATAIVVAAVALALGRWSGSSALTETDTVVLCFDNHTGEAVFDGTLQLALAVQLEQSPFLRVVSEEHVRDTLRLMGRPPDEPLTRAVAGEVCAREGARAVIAGSISRLGSRYVLGLEAIACATGEGLAREQVQAGGKEAVLETLGGMTSRLRRRLGESLASVARHDVPITRATTGSLDALQAASLGDLERRRGRDEAALALYRQAVDLDPSFALAYSRLGSVLSALGYGQQTTEAVTEAYDLRERTSLPERLEIEARYHQAVTGDIGATVAALEALKQSHPRSSLAHRGLAQSYALVGRYEEALAAAREAVRLEPDGSQEHVQLALAFLHLNRFDEGCRVAEDAVAREIDGFGTHAVLFDCAFARGDAAAMARERAWAANDSGARMLFLYFDAEAAVYAGRLRDARKVLQTAAELARERGDADAVASVRLSEALYEALYGRRAEARRLVAESLAGQPPAARLLQAAVLLALAGDSDQAADLVAAVDRRPDRPRGDLWQGVRATALAAIDVGRGRHDEALELLKPLVPVELGIAHEFLPLIVRGQAHLAAGSPDAALAAFATVLAHPGLDPSSEMLPVARLGMARAHALAGNRDAARQAYDDLLAIWAEADPDLPLLLTARRERQAL